jgi:hypothetical protein
LYRSYRHLCLLDLRVLGPHMDLPAGFIEPCLPTKADTLPSGGLWLHEIKHDSFRIVALIANLLEAGTDFGADFQGASRRAARPRLDVGERAQRRDTSRCAWLRAEAPGGNGGVRRKQAAGSVTRSSKIACSQIAAYLR